MEWIEGFEQVATAHVVDHGGQVIKTIGDEILFTADEPADAAEIALALTERGLDEDDPFPAVRAGIAYGPVVRRLGDVFGSTVNIAARLTSVARPGTVVLDHGAYAALSGVEDESDDDSDVDGENYRFRRLRRVSVKGYTRLEAWRLKRPKDD